MIKPNYNTKSKRPVKAKAKQGKAKPKPVNSNNKNTYRQPNKVQSSNNSVDYFSTIVNLPRSNVLSGFPRYNSAPFHLCRRKGVFTYPVNASGNIFIELNPTNFARTGTTSPVAEQLIVLNNVGYTDVNTTTLALAAGGNLTDTTMAATLGLSSIEFHSALVTGFHVKLSATGVSTGNRAGFLTMIDYQDDQYVSIDSASAGSYTAINSYVNARPMKFQVQNIHTLERDLATAYSNSFEYTWIPNFSDQNAYNYDQDVLSTSVVSSTILDVGDSFRKLGIYVNGANPSTQIRLDITIMYAATPRSAYLSQYPSVYGTDFTSPTVMLQKLGMNRNVVFREVEDSGMHGYIGAVKSGSKVNGSKVALGENNFYLS